MTSPDRLLALVLSPLVFFVLLIAFAQCAASLPPAEYSAELGACVEQSATLAESQACRCAVNRKWQRPCRPDVDGGAP